MTKELKAGWNLDNSYARLPKELFTEINPAPVHSPSLVIFNGSLAENLGLNAEYFQTDQGIAILGGNRVPEGGTPLAQAYAGHQFGHFTMLGDGRAVLLGEQTTPKGERFDIQLKGSGRTPYSRGGDGRATLGPMLREYIISEAMHALGIPTTRSLAVVTTGEPVYRETELPGAILTRVAKSHIRVGTFQFVANLGTKEDLRSLAEYTLNRHFPDANEGENRYLVLLQEVIKQHAELIANWQRVGFIHGVMNTDNMTISGETIDYGPCAFMDMYDPATVFSSIDRQGRYAYQNQPYIGGWNLARLAETLVPLLHETEEEAIKIAQDAIAEYSNLYRNNWQTGMRAKLGLFNKEEQDESLIEGLLSLMQKYQSDYTNTFRALTMGELNGHELYQSEQFQQWYTEWQARRSRQKETKEATQQLMKKNNPAVIPRNHLVEEALEAAVKEEDFSVMHRLLDALAKPYDYSTQGHEQYCHPAPLSTKPYRTFCGT